LEKTSLLGFAGFKAGGLHILTIDDRDKTPNFGKQLINVSTVIVTPPIKVIGIRGYNQNSYGKHAVFDVYAKDLPKELSRKFDATYNEEAHTKSGSLLDKIGSIMAIVAVNPRDINMSQKKPYVFEIAVSGNNNVRAQYDYVKNLLGKEVHARDIFQVGQYIDVFGITRGKGVEGPVTRFGIKRKQHKSRKSVRAVGTLGPISPAVVMYTVPRQGQRGFHQRTEYNKRILLLSSTDKGDNSINPPGGFKHFGLVKGEYLVVRGSIPGVPKRLIKMRHPLRNPQKKVVEPKIVEVVAH
jgi:large subunit ribosomal protein L3